MNELTKRILVAIIGIPVALAAIILGEYFYMVFIGLISTLAVYEFYKMAEKKEIFPAKTLGILINLLVCFIVGVIYLDISIFLYLNMILPLILLLFFLLVFPLVQHLFSKNNNIFASFGVTISALLYITFPMALLIYLRFENLQPVISNNMYLILLMFSGIWVCDTSAYFIGKSIGKRKLLEKVSPKKTIAGAVAGLTSTVLYIFIMSMIILPSTPVYVSILLGIVIGTFGQIGDLIESKFKRDAKVKDSGNIFPGHGGILDRFDSIIFMTPFVFLLLVIFKLI